MLETLLTFTGFHDPYSAGLVAEVEQPGPILSLMGSRCFDRVVLLSTPATVHKTSETAEAIRQRHPQIIVDTEHLELDDPIDHLQILRGLRTILPRIRTAGLQERFYAAVASGTPQMHACWILLAASGELPARILQARPSRYVTRERPLIAELDFTALDFPVIRRQVIPVEHPEAPAADIGEITRRIGIVGDHEGLRKALETAAALSGSQAPLLILGETGTGKELFARFVHEVSARRPDRFVAMNCAAISKDLIESTLFGHRRGAFTGAIEHQQGKFDQADGGTLFLDEVAELSPGAQAKLLRAVQDGYIEPLGAKATHRVDVRVVAATNRDLHRMVRLGKFRRDLYYRLRGGEVKLPPLRERRSDIPLIALSVLDRVNQSLRHPKRLTPEALLRLESLTWRGNIRELELVIDRTARLTRGAVIDANDLQVDESPGRSGFFANLPEPHEHFRLDEFLHEVRQRLLKRALEIAKDNRSAAARLLGITPQAVHKALGRRQRGR